MYHKWIHTTFSCVVVCSASSPTIYSQSQENNCYQGTRSPHNQGISNVMFDFLRYKCVNIIHHITKSIQKDIVNKVVFICLRTSTSWLLA